MKKSITLILLVGIISVSKAQEIKLGELLLIGNQTSYGSINQKLLNEIFKGRVQYWPNKEKVILVLPSTKSDLAPLVAKEIFNSSAEEMQKYWLSLVFQGRGNPPVFLQTSEDIHKYISQNTGSIGMIKNNFKPLDKKLIITPVK